MSRRNPRKQQDDIPTCSIIGRARALRRRGEARRALVLLRGRCLRDEENASLWAAFGHFLGELGRIDEAEQALTHALWLRRTAGDDARAQTLRTLLMRLDEGRDRPSGCFPAVSGSAARRLAR